MCSAPAPSTFTSLSSRFLRAVGRSVGPFQNQFRSAQVIFKSVAERRNLRGGRTVSTLSPMAGRNVRTCVCVRSLEGYTYVGIHTWCACKRMCKRSGEQKPGREIKRRSKVHRGNWLMAFLRRLTPRWPLIYRSLNLYRN